MDALVQQTAITLRLHYRNRMALLYSYLFPLIFLLAFYVLYRHESVVLARHMGELLTVGILGGACFGLPTTMVSERERGVWRRYRLAPVPTAGLVGSTVAARYVILLTAGLLQVAVALALGMPLPRHPGGLWIAFTFVSFAFIGLGLVMAMMADNVPAVQALGQCIFLPMLIIGGIAVPLATLPDWAQRVSAFFPGRYGVQAVQACINGAGLDSVLFELLALTIIGAAGCVGGSMMFRWDAQQRFAASGRGRWILVPLAAWVAVGMMSEARSGVSFGQNARTSTARQPAADAPAAPSAPTPESATPPGPRPEPAPIAGPPPVPAPPAPVGRSAVEEQRVPAPGVTPRAVETPSSRGAGATPDPVTPAAPPVSQPIAATWQGVTRADIDRDLIFDRLPSDQGVVAPIAPPDEEPPPEVLETLDAIRLALPAWGPAQVPDALQRARNVLYIAGVPDVQQNELERFAAALVFEQLEQDIPKDDLMKVLYWIALHPMDGDDSAIDQLPALGFENRPVDPEQVRERAALYAVKLLGRLTGAIPRN
ncbi:MAG: ABC transporter permease [Acidobacteriota bacterium]|nr:ABC transporter permease [Acidobacteriota bacterium]